MNHPPMRLLFGFFLQCSCLVAYHCCEAFSISSSMRIYQNIHDSAITSTSSSAITQSRSSLTHQHELYHIPRSGSNIASSLYSTLPDEEVVPLSVLDENENGERQDVASNDVHYLLPNTWIIQWRGEGTEGYSEALRRLEFTCAFRAEIKDYLMFHHKTEDKSANASPMELNKYLHNIQFFFQDALTYSGPIYELQNESSDGETSRRKTIDTDNSEFGGAEPIPLAQAHAYESAMQYVAIILPNDLSYHNLPTVDTTTLSEVFTSTIQRCSLIRTAFKLVASGESYEQLAMKALHNKSFNDIMKGGANENATWSIRLRRYGPMQMVENNSVEKRSKRQARYGKNVRSPLRDERKAILSMAELIQLFQGKVDLTNPECRIYLLEGLKHCSVISGDESNARSSKQDDTRIGISTKLLARVVAKGPKTSIYAPKTRICVTTTPLCPIASFTLCNIAQISRHGNTKILDPFAGSCATLLAAAHITNLPITSSSKFESKLQSKQRGCQSVAIEISHNGIVNRDDIIKDFETRSLPPPTDIIRGDCTLSDIRDQARMAIGGDSFDAIITDPPYGIREAMSSEEHNTLESVESESPLTKLFYAMGQDITNGTPLLKSGGRLVAFIPVREGETLEDCMPDLKAREAAGLVMEGEGKEQVLSDILSRWLVSFVCV